MTKKERYAQINSKIKHYNCICKRNDWLNDFDRLDYEESINDLFRDLLASAKPSQTDKQNQFNWYLRQYKEDAKSRNEAI